MVKSRIVLKDFAKMLLFVFGLFAAFGALFLIVPRMVTGLYAWPRLFNLDQAPHKKVAIVFGAGLWRDGSPTPVLRDRVETAAQLYLTGKVDKLLMSGDNRSANYNEPGAMHEYARMLGVPDKDIVLDYAGHRTYDTCYRAQAIFGVEEAILVTQSFHLPRAIYTCNKLGVEAVGVPAERRLYRRRSLFYWNTREVPATAVALWQVHISQPKPILGEPEPIHPMEVQ